MGSPFISSKMMLTEVRKLEQVCIGLLLLLIVNSVRNLLLRVRVVWMVLDESIGDSMVWNPIQTGKKDFQVILHVQRSEKYVSRMKLVSDITAGLGRHSLRHLITSK